jgi:6-phosphofructokinase 1
MNAAIRAVVRTSLYNRLEVTGIMRGYSGMINGEFVEMHSHSVSNIIQKGGTILKSARSKEFMEPEGRRRAYENLKIENIDAVVAIGGDGTFKGALAFTDEYDIPFIGIPGTIDNDLFGTDLTIGYDTAINTVLSCMDKIRDTADSHDRMFLVEVMGRDAGFIALRSGIASGAEAILIPERKTDISNLVDLIKKSKKAGKTSNIIIVAEGDDAGGAFSIAEKIKGELSYIETRVTILGHLQRGGNPSAVDRILASRLGVAAVEALLEGKNRFMVGVNHKDVSYIPLEKAAKHHEDLDPYLLRIAKILSSPLV